MNRERTREVLDKLGIHVVKSDGHVIEIHRAVATEILEAAFGKQQHTERWRVYTGGGIAGNSDKVWISPIARAQNHAPRGPYWNKGQLEKALRAWRRGE
jgi:hypothetical protein